MELRDVVMKLVGPVTAVGESHEDTMRFANLVALTELVEGLLHEINRAASAANNHQDSMKKIGVYARSFLNDMRG